MKFLFNTNTRVLFFFSYNQVVCWNPTQATQGGFPVLTQIALFGPETTDIYKTLTCSNHNLLYSSLIM